MLGQWIIVIGWATIVKGEDHTLRRSQDGVSVFVEDVHQHPSRHLWWEPNPRYRRQAQRTGFTDKEKVALLRRHNGLRRAEPARDMMRMDWDSDLERLSQRYAEQCIFKHSSKTFRQDVGRFDYVGENLWISTYSPKEVNVVQSWADEISFYNYDTMGCTPGEMCGHYTQIVWATSTAVGCGIKYCPRLTVPDNPSFNKGFNVVCHYGPGGNYRGQRPFKKGNRCSECPTEASHCGDGMCYREHVGLPVPEGLEPTVVSNLVIVLLAALGCIAVVAGCLWLMVLAQRRWYNEKPSVDR